MLRKNNISPTLFVARGLSKLSFVALLFLGYVQSFAQIKLYSQLEKKGFLDCTTQSKLWIDSTAKMPLQEVSKQKFTDLKGFQFPNVFSSEYRYDYWLKISVENPTNDTLDLLFTAGLHESVILRQITNNQALKIAQTYEKLLPNQRLFRADDQYIPIRFLPNKTYHFLVKVNDYPKEKFVIKPLLISQFWQNKNQVNAFYDEYIYLIAYGFLISVLFFVAFFVLLFYLIDRQKYYLYYGFYTISIASFNLWEFEHSPYFHFIFSYLPFLKFTGNSNIYVFLTHIFYFLFIFEFLQLKQNFSRIAKIFQWIIRVLVAVLVVDIFTLFVLKRLDWSMQIFLLFQNILPVLNVLLLIMVFKVRGRVARNIQVGSTFLMIGGFVGFITHLLDNQPFVLLRIDPSIIFVIGTLLEIFFFSIAIGIRSYRVQKQKDSLYKAVKESELHTLRSQINPHFVFNSLNSIKSYILTHRSLEAAEYLTDFSTLMRDILQHSKAQLISLADELETTLLYIKLEQLRFEDSFEFIYELAPNIDTDDILIPPMLLQPYIENAIKHGLMNKNGRKCLKLKIEKSEKITITIEDNGIGREQASLLRKNTHKYESMGMSINDERIRLLSQTNDLHIEIKIQDMKSPSGTSVIIQIPIE